MFTVSCPFGENDGETAADRRQMVVAVDTNVDNARVYVVGKLSTCEFAGSAGMFNKAILLTDSYGDVANCNVSEVLDGNRVVYTIDVLVQQHSSYVTYSDWRYSISCTFILNKDLDFAITAAPQVVNLDTTNSNLDITTDVTVPPTLDIALSVQTAGADGIIDTGDDTAVGTLVVGDLFFLKISLTASDAFQAVRVLACTATGDSPETWAATDAVAPAVAPAYAPAYAPAIAPAVTLAPVSVDLTDSDGCSLDFPGIGPTGTWPTTEGFTKSGTSNVAVPQSLLQAFKFSLYQNVKFQCTVKFCTSSSDSECDGTTHCQPSTMIRRKRDVSVDDLVNIEATVRMYASEEDKTAAERKLSESTEDGNQKSSECPLFSVTFLAVLSVFSSLLIISVLAVIYLFVRLTNLRQRIQRLYAEERGYKQEFHSTSSLG